LEQNNHFLDKARKYYALALTLSLSDSKKGKRTLVETKLDRVRDDLILYNQKLPTSNDKKEEKKKYLEIFWFCCLLIKLYIF